MGIKKFMNHVNGSLDNHKIKAWAGEIGFDAVGVAPAEAVAHGAFFRSWLAEGKQGRMGYLARDPDQRLDVRQLVPGAKSIICVALSYYHPAPPRPEGLRTGRVARYAWGKDYHLVMKERLHQLADRIKQASHGGIQTRCFVDTAPLLEKAHAARAGLGWIGKNGLLIHPQLGSWLVLGEVVVDMELEVDHPIPDQCGDCRRCLEVCPTKALVGPHDLDARRCVSYLTIESREPIPEEFVKGMGDRIFGCDACQEVCPYNQRVPTAVHDEFAPRADHAWLDLKYLESVTVDEFRLRFAQTALSRADGEHLRGITRGI